MDKDAEIQRLRERIAELEAKLNEADASTTQSSNSLPFHKVDRLSNSEIRRFGRQLILPDLGIAGT